jgi:ribokinase
METRPGILVVGSLNLDLVLHVARLPEAGETLASERSATFCGGKGANQAVACARMGATVTMIGCVGDDPAGAMLRGALLKDGIALDGIVTTRDAASGAALILLTPDGQNRIVLAAGANAQLRPGDVERHAGLFAHAGLLVCQLEVPLETVAAAVALARTRGVRVLLNPAPAISLPAELYPRIDILIPNELEARLLTGIDVCDAASAGQAAQVFLQRGVRAAIITLGAAGILIADAMGVRHRPALATNVVDTTAAGDSFIGGFASALAGGALIDDAAALGLRVASICVSRAGAQASLPYRDEV